MKNAIILFVVLFGFSMSSFAQYKLKREVLNPNIKYGNTRLNRAAACASGIDAGETIVYTPRYYATKGAMMTSVYILSFQQIKDKKYIYVDYQAWNMNQEDPANIVSTTFMFKDGTSLVVSPTIIFNRLDQVVQGKLYWSFYSVRSEISEEQLDLFTKKPVMSIAHNFKNSAGQYDAAVTEKQSYGIAMRAAFFLRGEKLNEIQLKEIFDKNQNQDLDNDEKWDF